jgi:CubicO group peptidase (beta-lactamase class C family)
MLTRTVLLLVVLLPYLIYAQTVAVFADSIRNHHCIPELGYAVVSSAGVLELEVIGIKKVNTELAAEKNDKFRIGSNTKAITGFIAAQLIQEKKIAWDTKFFDLFPELKAGSNPVHHELTLLDLLSFRTKLFPYTYTNALPVKGQFSGDEAQQRYQFTEWFFREPPTSRECEVCFSNLGYVAAELMLEKAAGKSYKELVSELGTKLEIDFAFGNPNTIDLLQPWGHDQYLVPEPSGDSYKLEWLLAGGNITMSLPDYARFMQFQLSGLAGKEAAMPQEDFKFLHFGLERFSVGWFQSVDENGRLHSWNVGNPGTFLSMVYVFPESDRALILFSNVQSPDAEAGMNALLEALYRIYVE